MTWTWASTNVVHILDGQGLGEAGVDSLGRLKVGIVRVEFLGTNTADSNQTNLLLEDSRGTHRVCTCIFNLTLW